MGPLPPKNAMALLPQPFYRSVALMIWAAAALPRRSQRSARKAISEIVDQRPPHAEFLATTAPISQSIRHRRSRSHYLALPEILMNGARSRVRQRSIAATRYQMQHQCDGTPTTAMSIQFPAN